MKNVSIPTAKEIFQANQILTVEKTQALIGKTVATTCAEYKGNQYKVDIFTISGLITRWDWAALQPCSPWKNRQEYWLSYMDHLQMEHNRNTLMIVDDLGHTHGNAFLKYYNFYDTPTFTGSDADRELYYIVLTP